MVKIQKKIPDKHKYYHVREGNSLPDLKIWIKWAKKNHPAQKLVIVDVYNPRMKDKKLKSYWTMRYKAGYESKYMVYGTY